MREFDETLEWYKTHTTTREIGFNPDGMCQKICRTARAIGALYGSAKESQDHTPEAHRVHEVRDLRRGMVLYFDDPNDSNRFGHVVTMIGRVKGFDPDSLHDVLVETNSVQRGKLTVVRGDYFTEHWGDPFQFGATWFNGEVLDVPADRPSRVQRFKHSGPRFNVRLLDRAITDGRRHDIVIYVTRIENAVEDLGKSQAAQKFRETFEKHRVLDMALLNGLPKQRGKLRTIIKSVPAN